MLHQSEEVESLEEDELSFSNFFPMKYIFFEDLEEGN
jgi:hypothetical protein